MKTLSFIFKALAGCTFREEIKSLPTVLPVHADVSFVQEAMAVWWKCGTEVDQQFPFLVIV